MSHTFPTQLTKGCIHNKLLCVHAVLCPKVVYRQWCGIPFSLPKLRQQNEKVYTRLILEVQVDWQLQQSPQGSATAPAGPSMSQKANAMSVAASTVPAWELGDTGCSSWGGGRRGEGRREGGRGRGRRLEVLSTALQGLCAARWFSTMQACCDGSMPFGAKLFILLKY